MTRILHGIVHGRIIDSTEDFGMLDGQASAWANCSFGRTIRLTVSYTCRRGYDIIRAGGNPCTSESTVPCSALDMQSGFAAL